MAQIDENQPIDQANHWHPHLIMLEFGYFHFPMYWFVIDRQYCCPLHHHCHKIQDDLHYLKKDQ